MTILFKVYRKMEKIYSLILISINWWVFSLNKCSSGINKQPRSEKIVISLTSYPGRIEYVYHTVRSLLIQSFKPDRIILWLCDEEFTGRESELPSTLKALIEKGLEIRWYKKNIGSYKKMIPTIREFPDYIIVTADDDAYYRIDWLKQLIATHISYPDAICAHRITKIMIKDNEYITIVGGYDSWEFPSYLNKLTGVSGVLYPPGCLHKYVTDESLFLDICTTNDDIWFWMMGILKGTKVVPVLNSWSKNIITIRGTQVENSLNKKNDLGPQLFWRDFNRMIHAFPELDSILRDEYRLLTEKCL